MTIELLKQQIQGKLEEIKHYVEDDVPIVIGVEVKKDSEQNFDDEGFNGKKWQDVKRRDPNSPWYGRTQTQRENKILHQAGHLKDATSYNASKKKVVITNDKPYARVHNEGLPAKIYGKKVFQMPKRQFIGVTPKLKKSIQNKIERDITKIINS